MPLGKSPRFRTELADALRRGEVRNMDNQRVEAGSSLGFINPGDGFSVRGIGGEAVNRFSGYRDRITREDQACGLGNRIGAVREDSCFRHAELVSASIVKTAQTFASMDPETSSG